jgi:hypothetical protein
MCQHGNMNIRVNFNQSFVGALHARGHNKDYRRPPCMMAGNGSSQISLSVDLFAMPDSPDYCGIVVNNVSPPPRVTQPPNLRTNKSYPRAPF